LSAAPVGEKFDSAEIDFHSGVHLPRKLRIASAHNGRTIDAQI